MCAGLVSRERSMYVQNGLRLQTAMRYDQKEMLTGLSFYAESQVLRQGDCGQRERYRKYEMVRGERLIGSTSVRERRSLQAKEWVWPVFASRASWERVLCGADCLVRGHRGG